MKEVRTMAEAGKPGMRKLSVWVPVRLHAEAMYRANLSGRTLTEYVTEAIEEKNEKEGKHEKD